jgi:GTPase
VKKCGFIALIGAPNAGKSSLVNALVGSKVTIVTHKVQTTRSIVRGIVMEGESQLVLIDTPGIFKPKRKLDEMMVTTAWGGASDADRIAVLVDAKRGLKPELELLFSHISQLKAPIDVILTKIDLLRPPELLGLATKLNEKFPFKKTYMVSSETGSGLNTLKKDWAEFSPVGEWHFPDDDLSDLPLRLLASEITREKMFMRLHDELPYESTVETETYEEKKDGSVRIGQTIYVARDGMKKIILGKNGETIKMLSQLARKELSELLEKPVHLFLFVKVREKWDTDPERLRAMGLQV